MSVFWLEPRHMLLGLVALGLLAFLRLWVKKRSV